ncbi:MAG: MFS transporter [Oscillospiraceae bacterium]|nr:MFS transporter [Oscillospiraceae bacterium]
MEKNYRRTLTACYLGFITQAITANFAPLLFLKFHGDYAISLGKIALIPTVFFLTQLLVDVFCAYFVDAIGYRRSVIVSELASGLGLIGLAFLPELLPDPFLGILLCAMIYAVGSGLIEVLVSPIVEACPFENKASVMSLLHSFYCWGSLGVILLSTLFFALVGIEHWKWLACLWALLPLLNIFNFAVCPIEHLTEEGKGMSVGSLFRVPVFWLAILLMVCAGASELAMAQWASAFAEAALGLSKTVGDLAGPCLFAVTMGICRVFYGKYGSKIDLGRFMIASGLLCLCCYLLAGLSSSALLSMLGCVLCGFSVGIMWPGTISLISPRLPAGGTALFALLAMAGDLGGAFGPGLVGAVTQRAGDNLQAGMLAGCLFPAVLVLTLFRLLRREKPEQEERSSGG